MFVNQSMQAGGAERQIFTMAKQFATIPDMDVSIFLLKKDGSLGKDIGSEMRSKITYSDIYLTEKWPLKPILRIAAVIKAAKQIKPDIIYARVMPLPCAIAGKFLGIPVVVVEINNPAKSIEYIKSAPKRFQTFLVRKISRKLATCVAANSSALADETKKYWNLKSRPSVIHNGLELERIEKKSGEQATHPWIADKKTPLIVSAGRVVPAKGFGDLIDAFAIVRKTVQTRLMIVGGREDWKEKERLKAKIEKLSLADCVSFTGDIPNPYPLMKAADVYVSSSLFEGFSNSILEALALGVPVVSTDHKFGANEIIEDGKSGLLVPVSNPEQMAEAILRILGNGEIARNLSVNARKRAQNFTIEKTATEYAKLFREIAGS